MTRMKDREHAKWTEEGKRMDAEAALLRVRELVPDGRAVVIGTRVHVTAPQADHKRIREALGPIAHLVILRSI